MSGFSCDKYLLMIFQLGRAYTRPLLEQCPIFTDCKKVNESSKIGVQFLFSVKI